MRQAQEPELVYLALGLGLPPSLLCSYDSLQAFERNRNQSRQPYEVPVKRSSCEQSGLRAPHCSAAKSGAVNPATAGSRLSSVALYQRSSDTDLPVYLFRLVSAVASSCSVASCSDSSGALAVSSLRLAR